MNRRALASLVAVALAACTEPSSVPDASALDASAVTSCPADALEPARLGAHLDALDEIAAAHGGDRSAGTSGYDASVDYVLESLRNVGLEPTLQTFELTVFRELSEPVLEITDASGTERVTAPELAVSFRSGSGIVDAPVQIVGGDEAGCPACLPEPWAGFTPGHIALARGEPRDVATLSLLAQIANAGALLVEVAADDPERPWEGVPRSALLPVLLVGRAAATRIRSADLAHLDVQVDPRHVVESVNVIAEIPGEVPDGVVMIGAHLDSVIGAPGINDNGTGVAAVLEVTAALQRCALRHPVRVAFWGGEEWGLLGSRHWVEQAGDDALGQLAAYLNLDMIGSRNGGVFVLGEREPGTLGAWLRDSFQERGEAAEWDELLSDRSDHRNFREAGVTVSGVTSGADGLKTDAEVAAFGGVEGEIYDDCYHRPCDDRDNVDEARMLRAAQGVGRLAAYLATR